MIGMPSPMIIRTTMASATPTVYSFSGIKTSHIVPWPECGSDAERLVLLTAHLDAAFDAHLIPFNADGQILFSSELSESDAVTLGLAREMRLRRVDPETEQRLAIHPTPRG